MKWTLLYFDDQLDNIEAMTELLSDKFHVIATQDVNSYSKLMDEHRPHAFLLDVHMPNMDGYTLYTKIQEHPHYNGCPIIFISGDQSIESRLKSHDMGAIDYISRELRVEELVVRLINKIKLHQLTALKLEVGNLSVDLETFKVVVDDEIVDLTLLEMRILGVLFRNYPESVTRAELIKKIWGDVVVKQGTVDTHITTLRPKLKNWDHTIKVREDNILIQLKKPQ